MSFSKVVLTGEELQMLKTGVDLMLFKSEGDRDNPGLDQDGLDNYILKLKKLQNYLVYSAERNGMKLFDDQFIGFLTEEECGTN